MSTTFTPWRESEFDQREVIFARAVNRGVELMIQSALRSVLVSSVVLPPPPPETAPPASLSQWQMAALTTWALYVETDLMPLSTEIFLEGAERVLNILDDETVPAITSEDARSLLAYARNRMVNMGEHIWEAVRTELLAGYDAGESIAQLADRLTGLPGFHYNRAETTARTEVVSAANGGSYLQMLAAGFSDEEVGKTWRESHDTRVRLSHENVGDTTVPLSQPFLVDIFHGDVKTGEEEMDRPGDPEGSAGNVINCRCTLTYTFYEEEEIMTAAGVDFVEAEHPRDHKGRFTEKTKTGRFLGGVDKLTGKKKMAGKPVKLRVKLLFETIFEDGAVVAERRDTDERILWDASAKKMRVQKRTEDGSWTTTASYTRGALMKARKDEQGWTTPTTDSLSPVLPKGKPVKLRVQAVYNTKYADGDVVAIRSDGSARFVWNAGTKRMELQHPDEDGVWSTTTSLTRGAVYSRYKDEDGWLTATSSVAPKATEKKAPAAASAAEPDTHVYDSIGFDYYNVMSDLDSLTFTGQVVGSHGGRIYQDAQGRKFLFKSSPQRVFAEIDVLTARLRFEFDMVTSPTALVRMNGQWGSLQQMLTTPPAFTGTINPSHLSYDARQSIFEEMIFDWLISNHDGHRDNYLKKFNWGESVVGIDKGQAFKFFGSDRLDWDFNPNPDPSVANLLIRAFAQGDPFVTLPSMSDYQIEGLLHRIENFSNNEYRKIVRIYAEGAAELGVLGKGGPAYLGFSTPSIPANDVEAFVEAAVARKNNLKKDFKALINRARAARKKNIRIPTDIAKVNVANRPRVELTSAKLLDDVLKPGQILGERITEDGSQERLIADEHGTGFILQSRINSNLMWSTNRVLSRAEADDSLRNSVGWFAPRNAQDLIAGDVPGMAPRLRLTAGDLGSDSFVSGFDSYTRSTLSKRFQAQIGDNRESGEVLFRELVNLRNGNNLTVLNEISLLQLIRLLDEQITWEEDYSYEKTIRDWLATSEGAELAARIQFLNGIDPETAQAFFDIEVSRPSQSDGPFIDIDHEEALAMQEQLLDKSSPWSEEQRTNLRSYSGSLYRNINRVLRNFGADTPNNSRDAPQESLRKAMSIQSAMRPIDRDIVVYRGVGAIPGAISDDVGSFANLIGKTFMDRGFTSTSVDIDQSFFSGVKLEIEVPKGTPVAYIASISQSPEELELLLGAGTKFRIIELIPGDAPGSFIVRVRVVA